MKTITYYLSPQSPWTYLGHDRLVAIAQKHGAAIEPRPCALGKAIFPISGGLPLNKRSPQRQAYRLVELQRWSEFLGAPLNLHPRFFPIDESIPATAIAAAIHLEGNAAALKFAGAILRAVWAEERDISNEETLAELAGGCGLDGAAILAARPQALGRYEAYTRDAIEQQVFGAPWYVYKGEPFWGQDRLDFLDRALAV